MPLEPKLVAIGDTRIQTLRAPRPGAPAVVLLAPWPLTLHSFGGLWPRLTETFDVTAIDLPGFGESPPDTREPNTPAGLARFVGRALDHLGLERVHLVGTDVGVPIGLSFAASSPARLASLVLSDGPGTRSPKLHPDIDRMVRWGWFRWFLSLAPGMFVRTALKNGYTKRQPDAETVSHALAAYRARGQLASTLRFLASYPTELPRIEESLAAIATPTLLLWGERDAYVPPENARELGQRLKNSEVKLLAGAGHFSHDDDPVGYASALEAWILRHAHV